MNKFFIARIPSTKFLGITLDETLSGKTHISEVCMSLRKFIGIFYKLAQKLPPATLKLLYFSFVYPHILYGIEAYANTFLTNLHDEIILNNRILRILQHKKFNSDTKELYLLYNIPPIPKLYQFQLLLLAHNIIYHPNSLPNSFQRLLITNETIHTHFTRANQDIHRISVSSSYGRRRPFNLCAIYWNILPQSIKSIIILKLFKSGIREFLYTIDQGC